MLSIRTQDRMALVPYNNKPILPITYPGHPDKNSRNKVELRIDNVILGTYATKERALEVLDEIEFCLEHQITVQEWKHYQLDLACGYSLKKVYQMPKE